MQLFGIKFAPLFIPIKRRIQTLVVSIWFFVTLIMPFICSFLYLVSFFTPLLPLSIIYLIYWRRYSYKLPEIGGRRNNCIRSLKIWNYFRDYFPVNLVKTANLDPSKNYIFGYHPHGILVCSAFCNFCTESTNFSKQFPGITPRLLTLLNNFKYPLFRDYILSLGLCSVSKYSINYILNKCGQGNAAIIVIGGAEEALESRPEILRLALRKRKGFIRLALENGADLVPCFGFHENELFKQIPNPHGSRLRSFQEWFKKKNGITPPLYYGRGIFNYTFGMMPYRQQLVTVIGKPISVQKIENPTNEDIDRFHNIYLDSLNKLFEDNKLQYGVKEDIHLEFY